MKTFKILLALLISITIITSCRKDSLTTDIDMNPPIPNINIETTLNGFVTDRSGVPIEDAVVSILNNNTVTNELGYFEIKGLVNEKFAVIKVEKFGFFNQIETLKPSKTAINRTRIQLTERVISNTLSSQTGGTVSINQSSSVEFQPNSFIDKDGNTYSGNVNIYTFFIDPTDENIDQIMPGNLMAINTENELNVLQSFGMINVELEGENGEKLNIDKPATINVNVPPSIVNNAPTEIPLWYFDEADGLWKEEGSATLQNGNYIGEVNHFTFWNCDVPNSVTLVSGQLFNSKGISLTRVRITDLSTGTSFTDWTDSQGFFEGGVPKNVNLLLEVLGFCGNNVIFSANIGPFTEDVVDLGIFNISNNANTSLVTGTLVDCNMVPIIDGIVYINLSNQNFTQTATVDASGNFSALIPTCNNEDIEVRGFNLADQLVSQPVIVAPSNAIDIGLLEVCTNVSATLGSVIINAGGEQIIFDNCTVTESDNPDSVFYYFQYYDALPNGVDSTYYQWAFYDDNNDLNNPDWQSFFFYSPAPDDVLHYIYSITYQEGTTNVTINQEANNPGDLMQITFDNIKVNKRLKDPNNPNTLETFEGSSVTITAVLQ